MIRILYYFALGLLLGIIYFFLFLNKNERKDLDQQSLIGLMILFYPFLIFYLIIKKFYFSKN